MTSRDLDRLRDLVVADPTLVARLLPIADRAEFAAAVTGVAAAYGLAVSEGEVLDALGAARRAWLERWV